MATIFIVEDDVNILEIETYALKNTGFTVQGFEQANTFYKAITENMPDLVLLDIMLPDEDGIEVLKRIRGNAETKRLPVIMVTAKSSEIDTVKGLDSGADDYITKPFGVMELISRVKALLRRTNPSAESEILELGGIRLEPGKRLCVVNNAPIEITYKEFELLQLLMKNAGIVIKRDVLMDRIWGIDFEGESRTLDMHIKTLRQKIGEASTHIQTIRNVGYVFK